LHLVHPFGFHLTERMVRRSGMDYFEHVELVEWASDEAFLEAHAADALFLFTGATTRTLANVDFAGETSSDEVFLCFGRESAGIDPSILARFPERCVRIPMMPERRSLNLSNSVAIALYEALRQVGYPGLV
jgi:tRNA (cytidine/uridine-2'-O-)-methyltransferase